jgi:hypothetical protein
MRSKRNSTTTKRLFVRPPADKAKKFADADTHFGCAPRNYYDSERVNRDMKLKEKVEELAASGYILLWLLGVPIPVLLLFFLLRGCT